MLLLCLTCVVWVLTWCEMVGSRLGHHEIMLVERESLRVHDVIGRIRRLIVMVVVIVVQMVTVVVVVDKILLILLSIER